MNTITEPDIEPDTNRKEQMYRALPRRARQAVRGFERLGTPGQVRTTSNRESSPARIEAAEAKRARRQQRNINFAWRASR